MTDYACAILINDGRVLLGRRAAHRRTYPGKWDVIGGKVEAGETIAEALVRELGEEIDVFPEQVIPFCTMRDAAIEGRGGAALYHMHLITHWSGLGPIMANNEHSELAWHAIDTASRLPDLALSDYRPMLRSIKSPV